MKTITATDLARRFREMIDLVEFHKEELIIVRNNHEVAKIIPGPATMNALEAMADLYRTLPEDAAAGWLQESRQFSGVKLSEIRDPWVS